jgi:endonuclease-3
MPSRKKLQQLSATLLEFEKRRAQRILRILRENLPVRSEAFVSVLVAEQSKDPFRVLTATILSQSCTDVAALQAYRNLDERIGVNPAKLGQAETRVIARAIRVAGLHHQKARALKRLGRVIAEQPIGSLEAILRNPLEEARSRLQKLPKVGPKTADVLLSIWGRPTISVDTHVNRVSKRLGLAPCRAKYEEVRGALMQVFEEKDYNSVPLLFMTHGRRICKARRPLCPECPVEQLCPYPHKTKGTVNRVASGHT